MLLRIRKARAMGHERLWLVNRVYRGDYGVVRDGALAWMEGLLTMAVRHDADLAILCKRCLVHILK